MALDMSPEKNLITKEDLARAREIDFVYQFTSNVKKLMEALGVTRMLPKQEGTVLKAYKAQGILENGEVEEGAIIPLSHYETVPVDFGTITLKKWRKSTGVESITDKGYDQAVGMTTSAMTKDVQKDIRTDLFGFMAKGTGQAAGTDFQEVLAESWGQLQILFEDNEIETVFFMNPLDVASYLANAQITVQNVFGMRYVEDFLGLGTVILNGSVPKGKIYSTAKSNIVAYYIPVNGAGVEKAFTFTSDETGFIGIHEFPDYDRMTVNDTVISGIKFFAERIDGIVVGTIGGTVAPTITLDKTTATIAVDESIKLTATVSPAGQEVSWESSDATKATVNNGVVTGVAAGSATITAKIGSGSTAKTATCAVTVSSGA